MALFAPNRIPRAARLGLATAAACFASTGVAQAGCPTGPLTQPFSQFGDSAYYQLVPDGGFEAAGRGWNLGRTSLAGENESYFVSSSSDTSSLKVPAKTEAVSPTFCVDESMPSLRLFARKLDSARSGSLKVEILYTDANGKARVATAGNVTTGTAREYAAWQPSGLLKLSTKLPLSKLGTADVQLRVSADAGGDWLVDDVYADPRLRH